MINMVQTYHDNGALRYIRIVYPFFSVNKAKKFQKRSKVVYLKAEIIVINSTV